MKIKVCGMRDADNIARVSRLPLHYMGFIFYPPSPRNCLNHISKETLSLLPGGVEPVAVTVDMPEEEIYSLTEQYGFKTVQLHGDESPEICRRLKGGGLTVIKAFGIKNREDLKRVEAYSGNVDYFLFDTATKARGGSGKKFDWEILKDYSLPEKFILSGGIDADSAMEIGRFDHPAFEGIDLNSRFETAPGVKDVELLKSFIAQIQKI